MGVISRTARRVMYSRGFARILNLLEVSIDQQDYLLDEIRELKQNPRYRSAQHAIGSAKRLESRYDSIFALCERQLARGDRDGKEEFVRDVQEAVLAQSECIREIRVKLESGDIYEIEESEIPTMEVERCFRF